MNGRLVFQGLDGKTHTAAVVLRPLWTIRGSSERVRFDVARAVRMNLAEPRAGYDVFSLPVRLPPHFGASP